MSLKSILIANRGEIAIRIARAAGEMGLRAVMVHSADDAACLHVKAGDEARALNGVGAKAYLDGAQVIALAKEAGCDAVHPGYGFLAENAEFARACAKAGLRFIGPKPDILDLFGDKTKARALAQSCDVPLTEGTSAANVADIQSFFDSLGADAAIMLKAVAGGGGRGMRVVRKREEIAEAFERCASEAKAAFGDGAVYAERFVPRARHIEVQIVGDGVRVAHLWERECSVQRRNQKLIEIAPASLSEDLRKKLIAAAVQLGEAAKYDSLGTIEFLVDADAKKAAFYFLEANPRLQVEHTVTEEVTGVDLVKLQIGIAAGETLENLKIEKPRGCAIQVRINAETLGADGSVKPSGGILSAYEPPSGPGVRVDGCGYAGYETNPNFDSLIAKLIVRGGDLKEATARTLRALQDFRIEGVSTTATLAANVLRHSDFAVGKITTRFVEENVGSLLAPSASRHFAADARAHVQEEEALPAPADALAVSAPLQSTLVSIAVAEGDVVRKGQTLAILEALKMEHVVEAPEGGVVRAILAQPGKTLLEGRPILYLEPADHGEHERAAEVKIDLDAVRPDLAEVHERHGFGLDANRGDAVARRRKVGGRTARENLNDLFDAGTFKEYGALTVAAQRGRRDIDDLMRNTSGDGIIGGVGAVNGAHFDDDRARCMGLAYDYMVLAGTQGYFNHKKTDKLLEQAEKWRLPIVWFTEGGGGRPGDVDSPSVTGLDVPTFATYARLSGLAPRIGVNFGRCFAGNAVIFGCCDITIATRNSSIGMGGPAMIEGGGLGTYHPDEVGPIDVQVKNGVVDVAVEDEAEGTRVAKQVMSYFQGALKDWACADQRLLRQAVPENRLRVFDVRNIIRTLADAGSIVEMRPEFGPGMITAFVRIEGEPFGLLANDCRFLSGAIDSDGSDKAARFMQLCDAFDVPIISLVDTPGFMVGPEGEKTAPVRHGSRMMVTAASMTVPIFAVVLRKGYGLGAQAMVGGSFVSPFFIVSWPTGEFGGMGLEGAVRLGFRKELESIADPAEQKALYDKLVGRMYTRGKAVSVAQYLEIDAVIDPAETRVWILRGLKSAPKPSAREGKKRPFIDTW